MFPDIESHCYSIIGFSDVVHSPEWFEARRKRSLDELIVTVGVTIKLLRGVVGAGVGRVVLVILLLTANYILIDRTILHICSGPEGY